MVIRDLRPDETAFLREMLYAALAWRSGVELPPAESVLEHPQVAPFHVAWGREGDVGLVAEIDGAPVGLAWYRFFSEDEHGEGFVDAETPEVAVAVVDAHRGEGVGTALMQAIHARAREGGARRISLSVDHDNPARRLYERLGYVELVPGTEDDRMTLELHRGPRVDALVSAPPTGRTFRVGYRIRLSDTDASGRLRLDAVARYLQDAATDDVEETSWGAPEHLWVLRSVRIDVVTPFLEDNFVDILTWGSSFSSLAAGRRWSLRGDAGGSIEVDSTWIHLDGAARPARIGEGFEAYVEATQGRVASTKLTLEPPSLDLPRSKWPLRATDVDRMGHVNNAAYWAAIEHRVGGSGLDVRLPMRARLDHRHAIDLGDDVELVEEAHDGRYGAAFVVGDTIRAVVVVEQLRF